MKKPIFPSVFILATLICLASPTTSWAVRVHGVLRVVKGKVNVISGKSGKEKRARVGQKVYPKDTIITKTNSRAKIVMIDKNEIFVSPESEVVLENYEYDPNKNKKNVLINVIYGKVRSKVKQKYEGQKSSQFKVKTPSAVAGVRGTDFFTSYDTTQELSQVITFSGNVVFGQLGPNNSFINPVHVELGHASSLRHHEPPASPEKMDNDSLQKFDDATHFEARFKEFDPRMAPPEIHGDPQHQGPNANPSDRDPANQMTTQGPHDIAMMPGDDPFAHEFDPQGGHLPSPGDCQHCPPPPPPNHEFCPDGRCGPPPPNHDFVDDIVQQGTTKIFLNVHEQ